MRTRWSGSTMTSTPTSLPVPAAIGSTSLPSPEKPVSGAPSLRRTTMPTLESPAVSRASPTV
jgi:hypothetical protein